MKAQPSNLVVEVTNFYITIYSQKHGLEIRVRSGGHYFEGVSYVSNVPLIIIDLINLSSINVDVENETACVQSSATIGQLYYKIAEKSKILAFLAGICHSVGVDGHFSGRGYGLLLRKYSLAADHVVDAHLIDVEAGICHSVGVDGHFRGRGYGLLLRKYGLAANHVVDAHLIDVEDKASNRSANGDCIHCPTLKQNATKILNKWQYIADKLDEDLILRIFLRRLVDATAKGKRTMQALFSGLFLGGVDRLLPLMDQSFQVLGLVKQDCIELSWIKSVLCFAGFQKRESRDVLLERTTILEGFLKVNLIT
ncbi:hypothetical protein CUMW_008410 [Citrus unshiu]|nr:hypothetical protein CUMW_008410 [Citrus unshiu]